MRNEYRSVHEETFAEIEEYALAPWASEGYFWPNRFPGEPEPPYVGPTLDDGPVDIL